MEKNKKRKKKKYLLFFSEEIQENQKDINNQIFIFQKDQELLIANIVIKSFFILSNLLNTEIKKTLYQKFKTQLQIFNIYR